MRRQLQIALYARTRVLRPLPFISMRQQNNNTAQQPPLVLTRRDELVDNDLRAIGEIAKLRLPYHQRLRIIAAVAVLETKHSGFRQDGVVDLELRLILQEMIQRNVCSLIL